MKICISSSIVFYDKFSVLKKELETKGHDVIAPTPGFESNPNFDSMPDYEIWRMKGEAIRSYFSEIETSDCLLVTNYEKKGVANYIGANAFLEMGCAYRAEKPIYILHELPEESTFMDEILGMQPIVLKGDISKI